MAAEQAGTLALVFHIGVLAALFAPPFNPSPWRDFLARWLLVACLISAATCSLINQGCAGPPRRVPVEVLMDPLPPLPPDPCPGGRPDPTREYGCAFPDSTG